MARKKILWLMPVLILLLAFAVRGVALGDKAVWWDEAWSVWASQHALDDLTEITARDVHPPIYQWALFGWIRLVGVSEFAVRALSALTGTLTVAVVYVLALRLSKRPLAAILGAFFIALSAFHIHWSQETRMYILAGLFSTLAVYAYLRLDARWSKWWGFLIVSSVGAALSQYLGGLTVAILCLHWLIFYRHRSRAFHQRWLGAMIVIGLLIGAWMLYAVGMIRSSKGSTAFSITFVFELMGALLAVGKSVDLATYRLPVLLFVGIYMVGFGLFLRGKMHQRTGHNGLLIVLVALLPPLTIYLLSLPFTPLYSPKPEARYFVIFAPVVYAGLGIAVCTLLAALKNLPNAVATSSLILGRRIGLRPSLIAPHYQSSWWAGFCYALFSAVLIVSIGGAFFAAYFDELDERYYQDDYAMMLGALDVLAQPDDAVFFISGERYPLVYYNYDRMTDGQGRLTIRGIPSEENDRIDAMMQRVIGDIPRFWLIEIEANLGDAEGLRRAWINERYQPIYTTSAAYNRVVLYSQDDALPPESDVLLPPAMQEVRPGDAVRVGVPAGKTIELLRNDQIIALRTPETWQLVAFPIPPVYPPGAYTLRIDDEVYDFQVTHSQSTPENPPQNIDLVLGDMRLLGYDITSHELKPGDTLDVILYWQAKTQPVEDVQVFFQLIGETFNPATNNPVWAQSDSLPAKTPPRLWWPGLTAYDRRQAIIPSNTPPGDYRIVLGLYHLDTGERVLTENGDAHIVIEGVVIQ